MKIQNFNIDGHNETFIIAEIAQAHDGSLGLAHSFIDAVAKTGAHAIKFQTHIANAESTLDEEFRIPMSSQYKNRWEYWKRMEFTPTQWSELARHAKEKNLIFLSSPFSIEAVNLLKRIGMPAWKIGSGEVFNFPIINLILDIGGPILLSSGMSSWKDIDKLISYTQGKGAEVALFQCTSNYPTSLEEVGINILAEIKDRYNIPNGLSDHSGSPWPSIAAIANQADFLEVHVNFDRDMYGPDSSSSLNISELAMVCEANEAFKKLRMNPVNKKQLSKNLEKTKSLFTKSLSPINDLPAGTRLTKEMLTYKKPGGGICSDDIDKIVGMRLKVAVPSNRILKYDDLESN